MPRLPFRHQPRSSEPATLRAEARLSRDLEYALPAEREARLDVAISAGEIDYSASYRIQRYLAWFDHEHKDELPF